MSPLEFFEIVTEKGSYAIGYLVDGWTKEIQLEARSPGEAMIRVQDLIGDIFRVTYIEKN